MGQLWLGTHFASRAAGFAPARPWPHAASFVCGSPTYELTASMLGKLFPPAHQHERRQHENNSVLIFNIGIWYNIVEGSCSHYCDATDQGKVLMESSLLHRLHQKAPPASRRKPVSEMGYVGNVSAARERLLENPSCHLALSERPPFDADKRCRPLDECHYRQDVGPLSHCDYAGDLQHLAVWIEHHRHRLPRHLFFIDSLPQRFLGNLKGAAARAQLNTDSGEWRNVMARCILAQSAPSVKYISVAPMLADRLFAHADVAHWCMASYPFEAALSAVLTAVVAHLDAVQQQAPHHAEAYSSSPGNSLPLKRLKGAHKSIAIAVVDLTPEPQTLSRLPPCTLLT
eukprot:CAMPEP_0119304420 /NCGR_PEP_ID=MMETSP1333-20130426/5643_1 /TAXON_ID=418940 /ORGANISM="Scyphosphaera apsteinii, Strain RCC1455" /LENGTH=342 /DNA_ID=CAMNT_0007307299 /DNA_START=425 /DNA_END=1450 /DNA_ORIENTATION=-